MDTRFLALLLAVGLSACGRAGPPVPVRGDVALLEGQWVGEYSSEESGRSGTIVFTLLAGEDTATGYVVMVPATPPSGVGFERGVENRVPRPNTESIMIKLVQVSGNYVLGDLAQYEDPDCGCLLSTTFTGKLTGDVLEGTYRSYHGGEGHTVEGRWRATRTRQ